MLLGRRLKTICQDHPFRNPNLPQMNILRRSLGDDQCHTQKDGGPGNTRNASSEHETNKIIKRGLTRIDVVHYCNTPDFVSSVILVIRLSCSAPPFEFFCPCGRPHGFMSLCLIVIHCPCLFLLTPLQFLESLSLSYNYVSPSPSFSRNACT
jgi:hypothetical protein